MVEHSAEKRDLSMTSSPPSIYNDRDIAGMDTIEPVQTNSVRPACFKTTLQEVLFVVTATMAIAMGALLTGSITVVSLSSLSHVREIASMLC